MIYHISPHLDFPQCLLDKKVETMNVVTLLRIVLVFMTAVYASSLKLMRRQINTPIIKAHVSPASAMNKESFSLIKQYQRSIEACPITTKMCTSAVVAAAGDIAMQMMGGKAFSSRRTALFATVAAVYMAPVTHYWFSTLDSITARWSSNPWKKVMGMLLLDQTLGAVAITAVFFYMFELVLFLSL